MNLPRHQRGIALLVAILLVAIGTIVAASIAFQSALAARRGMASLSFEESVLVAQGAEALAAYGLREDDPKTDSYADPWAQPFGPTEITPGVVLEARVEDLQGRFNLNSLINSDGSINQQSLDAFRRLLELLQIEPKYADELADWLDPDINPINSDGLEDNGTTTQQPPYRTANTIITSTSEMLALPGFGRERYMRVAPYIAALPPAAKLNVCTASGAVLDAMAGEAVEFSTMKPEEMARNREKQCFPPVESYLANITGNGDEATIRAWKKSHFDQNSKYYRLTSVITLGGSDFALYSLLWRASSGTRPGEGKVRVLQRSFTAD